MHGHQFNKTSFRCLCTVTLFCAIGSMLPSCNRHQAVLDGLVDSDAIIHSAVIRHGIDTIRIFEVNGNQETVDRIVVAWDLEAVAGEGTMSFLTDDAPSWWHRRSNQPGWQKYFQSDETLERYWSVWYLPDTEKVFIEVGQW